MATITELHVGWSETASLPDYNNVKPSVSLTIHLSEHDDPDAVRQTYTALCKAHVQEAVDQTLENAGMPARYSPEPRYDLLIDHFYRTPSVLIIIPTGLDFAPHFSMRVQKRGVRLAHAHALAQEQAARGSVTIVDCSDDPDPGYQALLAAEKHAEQMYTEREQREREPLERAIADVPEDEYEDESVSPF